MTSIDLPDSVHRYCVDERVRAAVDLLLTGKGPKVPATLRWDELGDFYSACLAAQRTRVDWARALLTLHDGVWAGAMGDWRPSSPLEQLRESDLSVAPNALWSEATLTRDHQRNGFYADPYVEIDVDRGIRFGIGLFLDGRSLVGELDLPWETIDEDYVASGWIPYGLTSRIDLADAADQAKAAVRELDRRVDIPG